MMILLRALSRIFWLWVQMANFAFTSTQKWVHMCSHTGQEYNALQHELKIPIAFIDMSSSWYIGRSVAVFDVAFVILLPIFVLTPAPIHTHSRSLLLSLSLSLPLTPAQSRSLSLTPALYRSLPLSTAQKVTTTEQGDWADLLANSAECPSVHAGESAVAAAPLLWIVSIRTTVWVSLGCESIFFTSYSHRLP